MTKWMITNTALSEVVHSANETGPQLVIEDGKEVAVVVSMEHWKARESLEETNLPSTTAEESTTAKGQSAWDFFASSPLYRSGLEIPARCPSTRVIDLSE